MRKSLYLVLSLCAFFSFSSFAAPFWTCSMNFTAKAKGLVILIGRFDVKGKGTLDCINAAGEISSTPVKIKLVSGPVSTRIAFGSFRIAGRSLELDLYNESPEDLMGEYLVTDVEGTILAGVGAFTAIHKDLTDIGIKVSTELLAGLGVNVGVGTMVISRD